VGNQEALQRDPYKAQEGSRYGKNHKTVDKKKFTFDQKGGSDGEQGSGILKSKSVDPVFGIEGRI